jgi:hypothetical protein
VVNCSAEGGPGGGEVALAVRNLHPKEALGFERVDAGEKFLHFFKCVANAVASANIGSGYTLRDIAGSVGAEPTDENS